MWRSVSLNIPPSLFTGTFSEHPRLRGYFENSEREQMTSSKISCCIYHCVSVCHGINVEDRRQLVEATFLLPLWVRGSNSDHRSFRASTFSHRAILLAQEHRLSLKVFYTTYCSLAAIETQRQQILSLLWGEEVIVMFNSGPVMKGWKVTLRQNLREFSLNKPSVLTEESFIQTEVWRTGKKNM